MPRFDGSGPQGYGPMTGRGMGNCNNYGMRGGRGMRGYGRMWGCCPVVTTEERKNMLQEELQEIEEAKKEIEKELKNMK